MPKRKKPEDDTWIPLHKRKWKRIRLDSSDSEDDIGYRKKPVKPIMESESENEESNSGEAFDEDSNSGKSNSGDLANKEKIDGDPANGKQLDEEEKKTTLRQRYELVSLANKKSRIFRTVSHVMNVIFKKFDELQPQELVSLFDDITKQVNETLKAEPRDKIRLTITHPSLDMGIHIPFIDVINLNGEVILDEIQKVMQSNSEFKVDDGEMRFIITHTQLPYGSGYKKLWSSELDTKVFSKKKHSVVEIRNSEDSMCFARSIVVSMCYAEKEDTDEWKRRWERIRKSNRPFQEQEAKRLLEEVGISPNQPCGVDEYKIIQTHLYSRNYVIKVHQQHSSVEMTFQHPVVNSDSKVIHIYYHQGHFDSITSITGFLSCSYYCEFCDIAYQNRENHNCKYMCSACFCKPPCNKEFGEIHCSDCNRSFYGNDCFANHKIVHGKQEKTICDLVRRCSQCNQMYNVRRKNHVCAGKKKCHICKKITSFDHRCHIQPYESKMLKNDKGETKKSKKSGEKKPLFIFYDFECKQDTGVHIPNYCIAQRACNECICKPLEYRCSTCSEFHEGREVIFQGENTLNDFCTWLFSKKHKGMTAIAHNFKGYDGQFILDEIVRIGNKPPELIMNGNSIISLRMNGVRLIDSYNFMNFRLGVFPDTFGLEEMKKGYFPHLANTDQFWDYNGPYLDSSYYMVDSMKPDMRQEFMKWYNDKVEKKEKFNFQREMESYCRSDVDILRRGCGHFRQVFLEHGGIDPFLEAITIADACNKVWRSNYLPKNQIAIISSKDSSKRRFSMKAIRWIQSIANEKQIHIQHARNGGEYEIGGYSVDGFHAPSNTVYEFLGDLYHGCPVCYPNRSEQSPINGSTMESLYEGTMKRLEYLRQRGYKVEFIWEHEFDAKVKTNTEYARIIRDLFPYSDPIDPREGLYGGRCNAVKLSHEIDESSETEIKYIDICSLYPYVCKYKSYPIGHPKVLTSENIDIQNIRKYEGLVKCKVLPPDNLLHPVLPVHCNHKMMFPLCRTCAENSSETCTHNENERALIGTWVTAELFKAMDKGYHVLHVFEIWHFDSLSDKFFKGYVDNFLKIKQEASGYPTWCITQSDREQFIQDYEREEGIKLDPTMIKKNKGRRSFAKIVLNCLWGKLAQREVQTQTEYIASPSKYFDLINNQSIKVKHVEIFSEECPFILVNYENMLDHIQTHATANVIVGSYVTAYARLELYSVLEKLEDRCLYFDTDSCMYIHDPKLWNPPIINNRLGKWTDEEPTSRIVKFRGLGPKNYAYQLLSDKGEISSKCKVKGVTLDYKTCQLVNFEAFTKCMKDPSTEIKITYDCRIKRHKDRTVTSEPQTKTFRSVYTKRVIVNGTDTVPFGHRSLKVYK